MAPRAEALPDVPEGDLRTRAQMVKALIQQDMSVGVKGFFMLADPAEKRLGERGGTLQSDGFGA